MKTSIHLFHKPEDALAFKTGFEMASACDDMLETELGPGPAEVTIRDHGCDEGTPPEWADHRLQIDAPVYSDTAPEDI